jgi:AraC family transcriptional regulator
MTIAQQYSKPPYLGCSNLLNSESVGWRALGLRYLEVSAHFHELEGLPSKDVAAHVFVGEEIRKEVFLSGRWRRLDFRRGKIATTAPGETWRLRDMQGNALSTLKVINLDIPASTFASVVEELPISLAGRPRTVYTAYIEDEAVTHFTLSLVHALRAGASNIYAESSAHWLASHLYLGAEKMAEWTTALGGEPIPDVLLVHVLEYIREHLKDDLSLEALAKEVGLTQFQFASRFQKAMGNSPHKHVLHLRMQNAKLLISQTKKPVSEISMLCGFKTASHFGVAFQKHFAQSPTAYRFAQKMMQFSLK